MLPRDHAFSTFSQRLQRTAAHESGGVLQRHYAISEKLEAEDLLMAFVNYQYVLPAEEKMLRILNAGPTAELYTFATSQIPREKFLPDTTAEGKSFANQLQRNVSAPRSSRKRKLGATQACRNKMNSKR